MRAVADKIQMVKDEHVITMINVWKRYADEAKLGDQNSIDHELATRRTLIEELEKKGSKAPSASTGLEYLSELTDLPGATWTARPASQAEIKKAKERERELPFLLLDKMDIIRQVPGPNGQPQTIICKGGDSGLPSLSFMDNHWEDFPGSQFLTKDPEQREMMKDVLKVSTLSIPESVVYREASRLDIEYAEFARGQSQTNNEWTKVRGLTGAEWEDYKKQQGIKLK